MVVCPCAEEGAKLKKIVRMKAKLRTARSFVFLKVILIFPSLDRVRLRDVTEHLFKRVEISCLNERLID